MRITDAVADALADIVPRYTIVTGRPIKWDVQIGVMPINNENMVIVQLFFMMRSPLLNQGDLAVVEIMPAAMADIDGALEGVVKRCADTLAEQSRTILKP